MLELTDEVYNTLRRVNRSVNRSIKYVSDKKLHPELEIPERWNTLLEGGEGDCDDYAVTKRSILREMYPEHKRHFKLCTCWVEDEYHLTLIVETNKGPFVLDNNFNRVMRLIDVELRLHKIENENSPTGWIDLTRKKNK